MSIDARDVHEGTSKSGLLLNVIILYLAFNKRCLAVAADRGARGHVGASGETHLMLHRVLHRAHKDMQ